MIILDGPLGTELQARGVPTPLPGWSAHALESAPRVVQAIHADYAAAGATVHTANTFRTRRRLFPDRWQTLATTAVRLAREALPPGSRLAGSVAPLEDCYRPDLSPAHRDSEATAAEHAELCRVLADAGCDLLLVETFPDPLEARLATQAAASTGLETWVALTPGPDADLLNPAQLARAAAACVAAGARAALVNCSPALGTLEYVRALRAAVPRQVPIGAYANAGRPDDRLGWRSEPQAPARYAELAATWQAAGATLLGSCCGTGPAHVAALAALARATG